MRNVHERVIAAPAEAVGVLLDGLGSDRDRLWPAPAWPPMQFDRPLGVGADGGHDEIRYAVSAYEPGRRVTFRFHPVTGLDGFHALEVEPIDGFTCVLRHVLEAQPRGRMRLLTPTVVRWLHDAVVEDLLDNAERAATGTVARPYRYSVWVRLLRWFSSPGARAATVPPGTTLVGTALARVDYTDAYSVAVPVGVSADPNAWADAFFAGIPRFAGSDMPRLATTDEEVLLGADGTHLAYRAGLYVETATERITVTVTTVVTLNTRAGRAYFAVVRWFHPAFVRLLLRGAALRMLAGTPASAILV